jgi:hypothetical protein
MDASQENDSMKEFEDFLKIETGRWKELVEKSKENIVWELALRCAARWANLMESEMERRQRPYKTYQYDKFAPTTFQKAWKVTYKEALLELNLSKQQILAIFRSSSFRSLIISALIETWASNVELLFWYNIEVLKRAQEEAIPLMPVGVGWTTEPRHAMKQALFHFECWPKEHW